MFTLDEIFNSGLFMSEGGEGGSASNPEANLSGDSSTPSQSRSVDGGSVENVDASLADLQKKLEKSQNAYRGMQRNYNQLFDTTQEKDSRISTLEEQIAELNQQIEAVRGEKEQTSEQLSQIQNTAQQTEQKATQAELEAAMYRMVAKKYQNLSPILESLTPKDSVEATEEMLAGMSGAIKQAADEQVKSRVGDYNTGGSAGRDGGQQLSQEALRVKMAETAGTPEYDKVASQYYSLVQAEGAFPKPKMSELDELLMGGGR